MHKTIQVNIAVEDTLSEVVLKTILDQSGRGYIVGSCHGLQGSGYLKKKIPGFNQAAKGIPFIILTDLDRTECAPELLNSWLEFHKNDNLLFRIAVREVESWVMAHREAFSSFLGIDRIMIPQDTDTLEDPKGFLINLASRSRKRILKESIMPRLKSTARVGPDYNGVLIHFVQSRWKVREALKHSPSLRRAFSAIKNFKPIFRLQDHE